MTVPPPTTATAPATLAVHGVLFSVDYRLLPHADWQSGVGHVNAAVGWVRGKRGHPLRRPAHPPVHARCCRRPPLRSSP